MTVSEYLTRSLQACGIDTVFGLPGVHALGMWNALRSSDLRYIGFRHEQAAAHAADGYGRATGKPGVVLLSTGPGALNALSALGEAYVSSSPVLAIASQIPTNYLGKQKGFLHESKDLLPAYDAVTRFCGRASGPQDVPGLLQAALRASFGGRPGPTLIEIPADLFDADLDGEPVVLEMQRLAPDESQIDEAASLLGLAARPLIWAGGGVIRSDASKELAAVADAIGAPVITSFMGKGGFDEDSPLAIGSLVRQPEAAALLRDADLMLAVGTRFSAMDTGNWKLEPPSQLIHIDTDPDEIGRNYPVRAGIASDAKLALAALAKRLNHSTRSKDRGMQVVTKVRDAAVERAQQYGPREMSILDAIRSAVPMQVPTVHDMTIASYWSAAFLKITEPRTFHYPYGFGSLGFSLPAAIGVAAARRGPVVSFSGDGGFQYHARELATIAQYNLPVVAIVFNDASWGILKVFAGARYQNTFGLELPGPDLMKLAEAHGIAGKRVIEPQEIHSAVRDAVEAAAPCLIEIPGEWKPPPPVEYYR